MDNVNPGIEHNCATRPSYDVPWNAVAQSDNERYLLNASLAGQVQVN